MKSTDAHTQDRAPRRPAKAHPGLGSYRERSLQRGVNPVLYWIAAGAPRAVLPPLLPHAAASAREHLPRSGPLLLASNHRSFLDPFVIGTLVRRPVYYMAKRELFEHRARGVAAERPRRLPRGPRRRR